jgi:hypothetical protein
MVSPCDCAQFSSIMLLYIYIYEYPLEIMVNSKQATKNVLVKRRDYYI